MEKARKEPGMREHTTVVKFKDLPPELVEGLDAPSDTDCKVVVILPSEGEDDRYQKFMSRMDEVDKKAIAIELDPADIVREARDEMERRFTDTLK